MVCKHCGKKFTCGCQKTKAGDGAVVHKTCLAAYNKKTLKVTSKKDSLSLKIEQANKNIIKRK